MLHHIVGVAELADAPGLGPGIFDVQVQLLSPTPNKARVVELADTTDLKFVDR